MPSAYFSKLRTALLGGTWRRPLTGQERGYEGLLEALAGQGKLLFGNSRSFHASTNFNGLLQPGTIFSINPDSKVNRRRNLTVFGALSRTFSVPSVSGPSFQVCGYHVDCLISNSGQVPVNSGLRTTPMASIGLRTVASCSCNGCFKAAADIGSTFFTYSTFRHYRKANLSLIDLEKPSSYFFCKDNVHTRSGNFRSYLKSGWKEFHSPAFASGLAVATSIASLDNSMHEEQFACSASSSEQKIPGGRILKLVSGSCYLPHPDKEETGGEDAHFICDDELAIGVADGVGGWAAHGVNAGLFARELMSNSITAIQQEPKGSVDPARVLERAHSCTKARGSSTACIIALTDNGVHAVNLGDSGFMVVSDGCTTFRSPAQQHEFNFTYQLESGNSGDLPSSGQVYSVPVSPGDVIIAGTDGMFDNLYNNEVTALVVQAVRAGHGPQVAAQKIAALARHHAQDRNRQTPFSAAAQDAGIRYYGGKLDDITVVVSFIHSSNNS